MRHHLHRARPTRSPRPTSTPASSRNTATAGAKDPTGAAVTSNPSSTSTPVASANSLLLTKSAAVTDVDGDFKIDLGDKIQWTFLVKNTGTTTLSTLVVNDPIAGAVTCPVDVAGAGCVHHLHGHRAARDHPGRRRRGRRQQHRDRDRPRARAAPPSRRTPPRPSPRSRRPRRCPLTKSAAVTDVNGDGKTDLGDTITWSFLVKNTGTVTAATVAVTDPKAGAVSCPVTTLAPGASTTCTAAGHTDHPGRRRRRSRRQHRDGRRPRHPAARPSTPHRRRPTRRSPRCRSPHPDQVGRRDRRQRRRQDRPRRHDHLVVPGQEHRHDDSHRRGRERRQGRARSAARSPPWRPGRRRPARRAAHTITQADVDAGVVSNTATATAKDPNNATVTSNPSSTDTPIAQTATLQLTKSAAVTDVNADGKTDLGDKITWSFLVKNTGTTTLTSVAVNDPTAGAVSCPVTTLAPGASTTCTSTAPHHHPGRRRRRRRHQHRHGLGQGPEEQHRDLEPRRRRRPRSRRRRRCS